MMQASELQSAADFIQSLCKEVGAKQLEYFRGDFSIKAKGESCDLVTEVDELSEKLIVSAIEKKFPNHNILCEESGIHEVSKSPYRWVIDPLDGTTNFSMGLPVFATSIALTYEGESILGFVYAPYLDEMYWATKGGGSFCGERKLRVGKKHELGESVLGTGFPYDKAKNSNNNTVQVAKLIPNVRCLRRLGAAAYDLCCVAAGHLDGYWEMCLKPWDIAAGTLIVKEAGGAILPWNEGRPEAIVAANKNLADKILSAISS